MEKIERRRRMRWYREFYTLAKPYWTSECKWSAFAFLFFILFCNFAIVYQSVQLNTWYKDFYDIAETATPTLYFHTLLKYCWIAGVWIALGWVSSYLKYRLRLSWRIWMTEQVLARWLNNQNHYFWKLTQKSTDNPDQRIAEDIQYFINYTLSLTLDLLDKVVTLFTFVGILWGLSGLLSIPLWGNQSLSIPGYLVWASLVYASFASGLVYMIGRKLVPLQYEQQHREADFRFGLVRIRENGESIAFAKGEDAEFQTSMKLFNKIVINFRALIRKFIQVEIFESLHGQISSIFPLFVAAPRLLSGAIKVGGLFQIGNAFSKVETSIAFLVTSFRSISAWRSATKRLADLEESLKRSVEIREATQQKQTIIEKKQNVKVSELELLTPDKRQLLTNFSLEIKHNESILFKGSSGKGKSTLFRAFAGIWPFFNGDFRVPEKETRMFLSQNPYLPIGSLRQALIYPYFTSDISDQILAEKLQDFHLDHLIPQLHKEEDWMQILSPGEKQRLVLIRTLIQKPDWLFLDEATSALDHETQTLVYKVLRKSLPGTSILSIGHREDLDQFHDRVIRI